MLGFKNLRTLVSTPMDVIEGSLEYAEKMDVKIGLEVHAPFSLNSGWADGYMEMIHRTGTKSVSYTHLTYLSKYIKQNFGMSFLKLLNNIRLEHAVSDLLYTDKTVIKIAMENGLSLIHI